MYDSEMGIGEEAYKGIIPRAILGLFTTVNEIYESSGNEFSIY